MKRTYLPANLVVVHRMDIVYTAVAGFLFGISLVLAIQALPAFK